jgi:hypothetical protein
MRYDNNVSEDFAASIFRVIILESHIRNSFGSGLSFATSILTEMCIMQRESFVYSLLLFTLTPFPKISGTIGAGVAQSV